MENDVLYNRIMNVIHEEYGEGSTAVANPEGEATDDLEKIQIGDEIYGISGGGGGSQILTVMITVDEQDETILVMDKTFNEINYAFTHHMPVFVFSGGESDGDGNMFTSYTPIVEISAVGSGYYVTVIHFLGSDFVQFSSSTADGVLTYQD